MELRKISKLWKSRAVGCHFTSRICYVLGENTLFYLPGKLNRQ